MLDAPDLRDRSALNLEYVSMVATRDELHIGPNARTDNAFERDHICIIGATA